MADSLDIDFVVNLKVKNAIDVKALKEDYDGDALSFIRYLVQEEGLLGCVEDDFVITEARVLPSA